MRPRSSRLKPAIAALTLTAMAAFAASAIAADPPPVASDPGDTAATFGDWVLHCERLPEGSTPARACEVVQSIQVQGEQGPIARIAIGRISSNQPLAVTVILPNNISLPSVVHVGADAKDKGPDLNWVRCTPGGCFAQAPLAAETLKAWRATQASKITFRDAAGRDIGFPISFRGLPQALDALAKAF
ncbi:MAG TPA: invasion associated locus B family protein [Caulobacteraceae bacterium]|jgi:invasion protein IalB